MSTNKLSKTESDQTLEDIKNESEFIPNADHIIIPEIYYSSFPLDQIDKLISHKYINCCRCIGDHRNPNAIDMNRCSICGKRKY